MGAAHREGNSAGEAQAAHQDDSGDDQVAGVGEVHPVLDTDGNRYYLHAVSDGTRGRMYTGWNLIDGVWYYFNPTSDGTKGSLFMNRQTPDGYRVDASGAWVE